MNMKSEKSGGNDNNGVRCLGDDPTRCRECPLTKAKTSVLLIGSHQMHTYNWSSVWFTTKKKENQTHTLISSYSVVDWLIFTYAYVDVIFIYFVLFT